MNHRLWAALSALAISIAPQALSADQASHTAVVTNYNSASDVVTGDTAGAIESLKHSPATTHQFVDMGPFFPPDPCRTIALRWNIAVFKNSPKNVFDAILVHSAQNSCKISYTRTDSQAQGSFDLITVAPTK